MGPPGPQGVKGDTGSQGPAGSGGGGTGAPMVWPDMLDSELPEGTMLAVPSGPSTKGSSYTTTWSFV
jgi:hypothetical protein